MKVCVMILCVGDVFYAADSKDVLSDYFTRKNIEYFFIDKLPENIDTRGAHPSWFKLLAHTILPGYDFIITWDLDLLPRSPYVDVIEEFNKLKFCICRDSGLIHHPEIIKQLPFPPCFKYNCGLMGIPSKYKNFMENIFLKNAPGNSTTWEQNYVNIDLDRQNIDVCVLSDSLNTFHAFEPASYTSKLIHYTWGVDAKNKISNHRRKYFEAIDLQTTLQTININTDKTIPKIIHQIAPADKSKWHPIWTECHYSWKKHFPSPEYQHILWNDDMDIDNLVRDSFPQLYDMFKSYPKNIQRIDLARYLILYKFGGIYADMDFICLKNFFKDIDNTNVHIVEHPTEYLKFCYLQNSLMASPKSSKFLEKCILEASLRGYHWDKSSSFTENISYTTGPALISDIFKESPDLASGLPNNLFNPIKSFEYDSPIHNESSCFTKHYGTSSWFKEEDSIVNTSELSNKANIKLPNYYPKWLKKM